ncbi:MAG TPA: pseudouridine synthase [Bacteroidia bacterium]|nr:pseudouridine synthase [Bacteroidia bacterium]
MNKRRPGQKPQARSARKEQGRGAPKRPFEKFTKSKGESRSREERRKSGTGPKRSHEGVDEFKRGSGRFKTEFRRRDDKPGEEKGIRSKRAFGERKEGEGFKRGTRKFGSGQGRSDKRDERKPFGDKRPFTERKEAGGFKRKSGKFSSERGYKDDKPGDDKVFKSKRRFDDRDEHVRTEDRKRVSDTETKPSERSDIRDKGQRRFKASYKEGDHKALRFKKDDFVSGKSLEKREFSSRPKPGPKSGPQKPASEDGLIRLNKYLSNAGIASRREADTLIQSGAVKVNGVVVDQLGYKIKPGDKVSYGDEAVKGEKKVYLLLNKPKDYITTMDDPQERKTVMQLIAGACRERVYPVGRLDRNTTGLLLFTNDGELAAKLTHPRHNIKKVYHVSLNKGLKPDDFKAIIEGVQLEDGPVKADDLAFVGEGKKEIGIEIHSGRNRVVRRMFEHLGYDVIKLDRVVFAGLTKKDLPRGKYRFITPKELAYLQMIG